MSLVCCCVSVSVLLCIGVLVHGPVRMLECVLVHAYLSVCVCVSVSVLVCMLVCWYVSIRIYIVCMLEYVCICWDVYVRCKDRGKD